jgi:tRNA A37 threonylcarbamoyladenosine modification protein TsaB
VTKIGSSINMVSVKSNLIKAKNTTLVLDPSADSPWVGLYQHSGRGRFIWRTTLERGRPGEVSYWPALLKHKKARKPERIMVVTGPGPFTATRAAVNIANALGFVWDVPVLSTKKVPNLAALLASAGQVTGSFSMKKRALPYYQAPVRIGVAKPKRLR